MGEAEKRAALRIAHDELVASAVAQEREACAKVAQKWKSALRPGTEARLLGHQEAAREIARAIRERGK